VLDEQMNNTSLVLLFEVGDKKLLFPGDAQIENWGYALQDAPNAATNRKLIAASDLYKVGHHGSRNATPRQLLWEAFTRRGRNGKGRLITLLSTMPGKHGKLESQTEVPRQTLVEALNAETELHRTDYLRSSAGSPLCDKVIIDT